MKSDYSSRKIYCLLGTPLAAWIIVHLFMQWFWGILPPAPIGLPNPLPFSQFPGLGNSDSEVSPRGSSMGFHASDQVTVHGVFPLAMPAGTPRQQAHNCGLKQRVSPDLKQRGSLNLEQRVSPDRKQRGSLNIEQRDSPCQSPPNIFPEVVPSAGSRWILIPPGGMGIFPP